MAITTQDQLIKKLDSSYGKIIVDKGSISNQLTTLFASYWRSSGTPTVGAIPTSVAVCSNGLTGCLPVTEVDSSINNYLVSMEGSCTSTNVGVEIHDRLVHMGGLSGTVTTAQNVLIDLNSLLATSNLDDRKGDANYSDVQWWLEGYTDGGATTRNLTINVTYNDDTAGNLTTLSVAQFRAGQANPLNGLIPASAAGKYIRGVNTVTWDASTGTAGNFGVTATRYRAGMLCMVPNGQAKINWYDVGISKIYPSSCLFVMLKPFSAVGGNVKSMLRIING